MAPLLVDTTYWNTLWITIFGVETDQERQKGGFSEAEWILK